MSSSERIRRLLPLSARQVKVGESGGALALAFDLRPQTVREAESHNARQLAALEERHQAERERAYRDGYNDGAAMARANVQTELDRAADLQKAMLDELARTRSEWFAAYESQMVELVGRALEQILGDRPPVADRVLHALRRAIASLSDVDRVTVRCHPSDGEFIQKAINGSSLGASHVAQIRVTPDDAVGPGGCLVESTLGVVDARIEQQLAILRGVLHDVATEQSANGDSKTSET